MKQEIYGLMQGTAQGKPPVRQKLRTIGMISTGSWAGKYTGML